MSSSGISSRAIFSPGKPLRGAISVPGCKGISHRALLFAALSDGRSVLRGLSLGGDVKSTLRVLEQLEIFAAPTDGELTLQSRGYDLFTEPDDPLDCGNSGTTMRMLAGILVSRPFHSVLVGDESLSSRPMARIVEPLHMMGAKIVSTDGHSPIEIDGGVLTGCRHDLPVASGQVKSALLFAGMQASGWTEIHEPQPSRDHTERMLRALGAPIEVLDSTTVKVRAVGALDPFTLEIPGDASSAAFFVVAATIVPGSEITIKGVGLNPLRVAYLDVLIAMGANIESEITEERLGEPVGDITVRSAPLSGVEIESSEGIIDELPILAVAAATANGQTTITGAGEMRVKESDRIATTVAMLEALGVRAVATDDGMRIEGGSLDGGSVETYGDHRIAMCAAVAALACSGSTEIIGWDAVDVSYPGFDIDLARLRESN